MFKRYAEVANNKDDDNDSLHRSAGMMLKDGKK
jgi:hypothetical protein